MPARDDQTGLLEVAQLVHDLSRTGRRLPSVAEIRDRYRHNLPLIPMPTVSEWLDRWLATRTRLRANTRQIYQTHIRLYLKPYLGGIRLDRLRTDHVADMFDQIHARNDVLAAARASSNTTLRRQLRWQRHVGPATMQRIRAVLRTALNGAIAARLITFNAAAQVELPDPDRPVPLIWTPPRVARWRATGQRPSPVMVWTPELTGRFLDHARRDPLYPLYELIALRGLRRGEACGLHWSDVDLDAATLQIRCQLLLIDGRMLFGPPKSRAGRREVALDHATVASLHDHRARQLCDRAAAGPNWHDSDLVFSAGDGTPLHPDRASDHSHDLVTAAGLPPVRLHDLRHGAATLMLTAGVSAKVIQETLGHSRYTTTLDIYTSVLPTLAHAAAEATAALIPHGNADAPRAA